MKNSSKYFCNKECEYFPCHKGMEDKDFNCLFCYCPLVNMEKCPGNPKFIQYGSRTIKDCSGCTFPHVPENYAKILKILSAK